MPTNQISLLQRTKAYLSVNWGAPCILLFLVLLIVSAVLLAINVSGADTLATYGFYALVAGVFLQIVCTFNKRKSRAPE
jgi:hypothetical protein